MADLTIQALTRRLVKLEALVSGADPYYVPLRSSLVGDHFVQNEVAVPAAWTPVDVSVYPTNTTTHYSYWFIPNTTSTPNWKYRRQTGIVAENATALRWCSFYWGPVLWRDTNFSADVTYKFGVYRDNGGVIDEQTYIRAVLKWNDASSEWQVFGEEKDGTTAHTSAASVLTFPLHQPLWFRTGVRVGGSPQQRVNVGTAPMIEAMTLLQAQVPTVAPTWGNVWIQIEESRGAGIDDYLLLGAVDYAEETA